MAVKVDEALQRSTQVLLTGDLDLADTVVAGVDEIDAMGECLRYMLTGDAQSLSNEIGP